MQPHPEINGIRVTQVPNDAVYAFVMNMTTGNDEIVAIAARLHSLVGW